MSTTYTGVGGNVTQSTSPTITVPADGDSLAVTSVNVAMDKLMDYIALVFGGAFTGQASATPGLSGTGGATAQGVKATAGGGASPVKGMVNLVPTTNAPSAPVDGDFWVTTGGVVQCRANGVVVDITRQWAYATMPPSIRSASLGTGQVYFTAASLTSNVSGGSAITITRDTGLDAGGVMKIVLNQTGTYRFTFNSGVQYDSASQVSMYLRRTNNTAANVPDADSFTHQDLFLVTANQTRMVELHLTVVYTTAATTDALAFQWQTNTLGTGTVTQDRQMCFVEKIA